jgi:hypothetical protein
VRAMIQPIVGMVYNEIYPYIWFICIYHVFLIFIILANCILLFQWVKPQKNVGDIYNHS